MLITNSYTSTIHRYNTQYYIIENKYQKAYREVEEKEDRKGKEKERKKKRKEREEKLHYSSILLLFLLTIIVYNREIKYLCTAVLYI